MKANKNADSFLTYQILAFHTVYEHFAYNLEKMLISEMRRGSNCAQTGASIQWKGAEDL